jgi:hypothetical protein
MENIDGWWGSDNSCQWPPMKFFLPKPHILGAFHLKQKGGFFGMICPTTLYRAPHRDFSAIS